MTKRLRCRVITVGAGIVITGLLLGLSQPASFLSGISDIANGPVTSVIIAALVFQLVSLVVLLSGFFKIHLVRIPQL